MSIQTNISIDDLTNRELITPCSEQTYEPTQEVVQAIEETEQAPIEDHPVLQDNSKKAALLEICADDIEFLRKYVAIAQQTEDLSFETQITLVFLIDQFIKPKLNFDGVPRGFLPVRGKHLQTAIELHPRAVVYAWRHNCDSCDTMKETLETVFDPPVKDFGLFAVYGTNCPVLLHEQFDIEGAPTTLFCANGVVDSRLMGAQYQQSVESELEMIDKQVEG